MAYKMTKRGSMDNEITNEFYCDTMEDRDAIPASQINLGTVAIVLKPTLQVFIAGRVCGTKSLHQGPYAETG